VQAILDRFGENRDQLAVQKVEHVDEAQRAEHHAPLHDNTAVPVALEALLAACTTLWTLIGLIDGVLAAAALRYRSRAQR
jgi:uncharacterized pyridoxal phosphate-containing UPF0001 family protein